MVERCFACDRPIRSTKPKEVDTRDGQTVYVGANCFWLVTKAGNEGYQPPKGGPRLYPMRRHFHLVLRSGGRGPRKAGR